MFDKYKKEFMEIESLEEFEDFKKKYPNFDSDEEMRKHFMDLVNKFMELDTPENHSDPREAFIKK
ncbi:MAG: hypothetical protein WCZ27_11075 [Tissierellaceae bacterium]